MASSKTPTATWPVPSLIRSLARAGWADVLEEDRACRVILRGLSDGFADDKSGVGKATLWQIGQVAGYSKNWVSIKLAKLEEAGIIAWERGGIVCGKHIPSHFTIVKKKLVELIFAARKLKPVREHEHYTKENERIVRNGYTWGARKRPRKKKRRSDHAPQNGNHLSPIGGVNTTPPSRPTSHLDGIGLSEAEKTLIVRQGDAAEASAHASVEANLRNKGAGLTLMADAASSDGGPATSRAEWLRAQLEATSPGMGKAFDRARAKRRRPWSPKGQQ